MCNLKSNKTLKEILEYKKALENINLEKAELVLFPSTLYLSFFYNVPYKIGSQTISVYEKGSFTGEILASQLKSLKVSYVLVNHFEMQDMLINVVSRIKMATRQNIKVVLCIGEKTKQTMDETIEELKKKLKQIFSKLTQKEIENIILAYEPCWAIKKQDIVNIKVINNIAKKIKEEVQIKYHYIPFVLYGGGITIHNSKELAKVDNIDGYLIGNCANNPKNICKVLDNL